MSRPGTDRLKFNAPLGTLPALQYLLPAQLDIDPSYQRSLETDGSQTLVRGIAQHWNWDLCQPLVVARRDDGKLYVIDGQHRLAAARLRGDIQQLPAVVVQYASAQDEAASFVLLNQQRKPLSKIDLFKAAVASGDRTATAIVAAMERTGLSLAPHTNFTAWKPGMVANIAGIEAAWRTYGSEVTTLAMRLMVDVVGNESQEEWRAAIMRVRADHPDLNFAKASAKTFLAAWGEALDEWMEDQGDVSTEAVQEGPSESRLTPEVVPDLEDELRPDGPDPDVLTKLSAAQMMAAAPAPRNAASAAPKTIGPIDWGKISKGKPKIDTFKADGEGKCWCKQHDRRVTRAEVRACRDKHCPFGGVA